MLGPGVTASMPPTVMNSTIVLMRYLVTSVMPIAIAVSERTTAK
jgi:hypothetical protein